MNSRVFQGSLGHCRLVPTHHAFRYRMFWLMIDVDELPALSSRVFGFGHNRPAIAAIHDRDYGDRTDTPIRGSIEQRLSQHGITTHPHRILLITVPRVLGCVFNPVNFYICSDERGHVIALVSEVNNTFGETHFYVSVPDNTPDEATDQWRFTIPKEFYVSPFFDVTGAYDVTLNTRADSFDLAITLQHDEATVFSATMCGTGQPLNASQLWSALARNPVFALTVMLRIHIQAVHLMIRKRVRTHDKPEPSHAHTVAASKSRWTHRLRTAWLRRHRTTARQAPLHSIPERAS